MTARSATGPDAKVLSSAGLSPTTGSGPIAPGRPDRGPEDRGAGVAAEARKRLRSQLQRAETERRDQLQQARHAPSDGSANAAHEPSGAFVDAHVHFWDRALFGYPWLERSSVAMPYRFLPDDIEGRRAEALVFVQADCLSEQGIGEAAWAAELLRARGGMGAVVAFAPLEDELAAPEWIERLRRIDAVVGVRRLLQDEPDELLRSQSLIRGLRRAAAAGLSFDACVRAAQLPALVALRREVPECRFVLDHMGKPPVRAGWGCDAARRWHAALRRLAAEPDTTVKLSGLAPEAAPRGLLEQVRPFVDAVIDCFGAERCMAGSDFPVSAASDAAVPYAAWFDFVGGVASTPGERRALVRETAVRTYRLRTTAAHAGADRSATGG